MGRSATIILVSGTPSASTLSSVSRSLLTELSYTVEYTLFYDTQYKFPLHTRHNKFSIP